MHSPWLSWCYLYGVGGLLFIASLLISFGTGAVSTKLWADRRLTAVLIAGFVLAAAGHAAWISAAAH